MANDLRPPAFVTAAAPYGQVFYVGNSSVVQGSIAGSNNNSGLTKEDPWSTLAYAVTQVTAGRGDTVNVLPGHAETITGAAGIAISKSGMRVIGQGQGALRPTFTFTTAAAASFDITGANCTVENCYFVCNIASQTAMVNVTGTGCTIRNCEWLHGTGSNHALIGLLATGADKLLFEGNRMFGLTTGTAGAVMVAGASAVTITGGDKLVIQDNVFSGRWTAATVGVINVKITATTNAVIRRNFIGNFTTSAAIGIIDTVTGSTGLVDGNRYQILTGTAPLTGVTWQWGLNYYSATIGTAMTVI